MHGPAVFFTVKIHIINIFHIYISLPRCKQVVADLPEAAVGVTGAEAQQKKNRNACQVVRAEIDRNIRVTKSAARLALCVACVEDRPRQERLECNYNKQDAPVDAWQPHVDGY